jgi:transcriptional regulator with XRE-family HTH domain
MDDVRVGSIIRSVRIRRGMRQSDVAAAAAVSQGLVSAIEGGDIEATSLRLLRRVAAAVGVSIQLELRWRGADLAKLLDERHASIVRQVVERLTGLGWIVLPEQTFNIRGERGSIDVLCWFPASRAVLVVEVKTRLVDLQDLLSTLDRKRRLVHVIAQEAGWRPLQVG